MLWVGVVCPHARVILPVSACPCHTAPYRYDEDEDEDDTHANDGADAKDGADADRALACAACSCNGAHSKRRFNVVSRVDKQCRQCLPAAKNASPATDQYSDGAGIDLPATKGATKGATKEAWKGLASVGPKRSVVASVVASAPQRSAVGTTYKVPKGTHDLARVHDPIARKSHSHSHMHALAVIIRALVLTLQSRAYGPVRVVPCGGMPPCV